VKLTFQIPSSNKHNDNKLIHKYKSVEISDAKIGENLLRLAQRHDIPLEGACEGVCACSTCHVILADESFYEELLMDDDDTDVTGNAPSEDEEDMLDMAFGLTATSRLGCQVKVTENMEGRVFVLPVATRNFYVDGHVPQPH